MSPHPAIYASVPGWVSARSELVASRTLEAVVGVLSTSSAASPQRRFALYDGYGMTRETWLICRVVVSVRSTLPVTTVKTLGSRVTPLVWSTAQCAAVSTTFEEMTVPLQKMIELLTGPGRVTNAINGQLPCVAP